MRVCLLNVVIRIDAVLLRLKDCGIDDAMVADVTDCAETVERVLSDVGTGSRDQVRMVLAGVDTHIESYPAVGHVDTIVVLRRFRDVISSVA